MGRLNIVESETDSKSDQHQGCSNSSSMPSEAKKARRGDPPPPNSGGGAARTKGGVSDESGYFEEGTQKESSRSGQSDNYILSAFCKKKSAFAMTLANENSLCYHTLG